MLLTSETTCKDVKRSNPVITVILSQLHRVLVQNCKRFFQQSTFKRSFLENRFFSSERLVSHSIISFLNDRDLNKLQQNDSPCDVCAYHFARGVNFCGFLIFAGYLFCGNYFFADLGNNRKN